jgi:hypothetical protein
MQRPGLNSSELHHRDTNVRVIKLYLSKKYHINTTVVIFAMVCQFQIYFFSGKSKMVAKVEKAA